MSGVRELCKRAKAASYKLAALKTEEKNAVLLSAADMLLKCSEDILDANERDVQRAEEAGMSEGLIDRLCLSEARIADMAEGIRSVAALPDPVGIILEERTLSNGLKIQKVSVPLGVVGMIYEARPNVTSDAFSLCFKSGNACVLKGGSAAAETNRAIAKALREGISTAGQDADSLMLIDDMTRESTVELMKMHGLVDVLIPRGGSALIQSVVENASVPVIETGSGNCHIYVDEAADLKKAVPIIVNAKTQRTGVCNACESLLIHEKLLQDAVPLIVRALSEKHVRIYADDACRFYAPKCSRASEEDWGKEYLALALSMKAVSSIDEAIAHINRYNTKHSDCIITEDEAHARKFQQEVDAACVYVNASTRFTDGGQFGFGCEIGISTGKLHARGPMGLSEMTSYKYLVTGNGQVRP